MPTINTGPSDLSWNAYVGDANRATLVVSDSDGTPVDFTGALIEAQARVSAADPTIAVTAVVDAFDLYGGRFDVSWPGEELRALLGGQEAWKGVWDLQVTMPGATLPTTLLRGTFTATHDVTRVGVTA